MPDDIAAQLIALTDAQERRESLLGFREVLDLGLIESLKAHSDTVMLRDSSRALEIAETALEAARLITHPLAEPVARWARGNALLYQGRYQECLADYEYARLAYARQGQTIESARLRVNQIAALRHLGRYVEALKAADEARERLADIGLSPYTATLEMNLGLTHLAQGHFDQAQVAFDRGRSVFIALGFVLAFVPGATPK